jgi:hypothetical protein
MIGLSLGLSLGGQQLGGGQTPDNALCDAIKRKVCVTATHNRRTVTLEPHIVYKRGAKFEMTLDAVRQPEDGLRSFAVSKLTNIVAVDAPFVPNSGFNPDLRRYRKETTCVVQLD